MADPLTIISALGTCAGLLGFVAGSIRNVAEVVEDTRQCDQRLNIHCGALDVCHVRLESWATTWIRHASTEHVYHVLWGNEGWRTIQRHFQTIQHEVVAINNLLFGTGTQHGLNCRDLQDWYNTRATASSPAAAPIQSHRKNIFKKLTYSLYKERSLKKSINRLRQLINDLEICSVHLFQREHEDADLPPIGTNEHEMLVHIETRMADLRTILTTIYQNDSQSGPHWALMLSPQLDWFRSLNFQDLEIAFLHTRQSFAEAKKGRRVVTNGLTDVGRTEDVSTLLARYLPATQEEEDVELHETLKTRIGRVGTAVDIDTQRKERRDSACERAVMALSIVMWATFTWCTTWMEGLCSCKMRYTTSRLCGDVPALGVTAPTSQSCSANALANRPHMLVGLLLAELGLSRSIKVVTSNDKLLFHLDSQPNAAAFELYGLLALLQEATSIPYKHATWYCFQRDASLQRQNRSQQEPRLRAAEFKQFRDSVIGRLLVHHDGLLAALKSS